jgi:hypothetical protein
MAESMHDYTFTGEVDLLCLAVHDILERDDCDPDSLIDDARIYENFDAEARQFTDLGKACRSGRRQISRSAWLPVLAHAALRPCC